MSISYLTSPNDFSLYSKNLTVTDTLTAPNFTPGSIDTTTISVETLTLTNKQTLNLGLWALTGFGWEEIPTLIDITYRIIDKLIFIEIPMFTSSLPSGVNQLAISQEIFTDAVINWGFGFRYQSLNPCMGLFNSGNDETIYLTLYDSSNTAIYISRDTPYSAGLFKFYPTVLTLILS